jgi:hypothetical protein
METREMCNIDKGKRVLYNLLNVFN